MENYIKALLFIFIAFTLFAENVWTKANSPYFIGPEKFIAEKLIIEPGVTVILECHHA